MAEPGKPERTVLLITNIPTPYRIPLFNEISDLLTAQRVAFKVVFGGATYSRRQWQIDWPNCRFDYSILKSRTLILGNTEKTMFFYSGLLAHIASAKPVLVVSIGFSLATFKVFLLSLFRGQKYMIWSGSLQARSHSFFRTIYRKVLVHRTSAFIAYGMKARDYLISLGAPPSKVSIALNTTDTEFYSRRTSELRTENGPAEGKRHLLYVGYLSPRKNVQRLLEAIIQLRNVRNDFVLDIVGEGSDKKSLESFVNQNKLDEYVEFHGNKQKEQIPFFLAMCDCFLFQTDFDIWGLVLNEAMAAGVPCISSLHAGATHDLLRDGITGFALDFADSERLVAKVNWILDHPREAREMGERAAAFIRQTATIKKSAASFAEAILAQLR